MANFTDIDDLRTTALWRAGEPQDSTSDFWAQSLVYLNKIQQLLLLGGGVAVGRDLATSAGIYNQAVAIPITDWWWAQERAVLTTTQAINAGTVTMTKNSSNMSFSSGPVSSVAGYRLFPDGTDTMPIITTHTALGTIATMDAIWPRDTATGVTYRCWQEEYSLSIDFLRFSGAPWLHSDFGPPIPGMTKEQLLTQNPGHVLGEGPPEAFATVGDQTIIFDRYDTTRRYRFEYDYIRMPTDLAAGETPLLPRHHRQVLSTGAAMLIMFDKNDARAQELASEYREMVARMGQEHRKNLGSGSNVMGQYLVRRPGTRRRGSQPNGEIFLT
jgi:hypothetical protein